jgi:hypothetical protein
MNRGNFPARIFLVIAPILISIFMLAPVLAHADSYDGPYCFDSKSGTLNHNSDPSDVSGTCKEIKIQDVVTLDPALQNSYFIGTHNGIGYNCERFGCADTTKYSEQLTVQSSSTVILYESQPDYVPTEAAIFDKSFFLPLLLNQFKQTGLNFSGSNFPPITINVYNPSELNEIENDTYPPLSTVKMDALANNVYGGYSISTLNYQAYGKYIWGPKEGIAESQYTNIYKNDQALTSNDLSISTLGLRHGSIPTVSVADPLDSVTNYWIYAQVNGKLALSWQKTVYGFDDGTIKTVVPGNISGTISSSSVSSTLATTTATPIKTAPAPATVEKNIFQKIWDFITSWLR